MTTNRLLLPSRLPHAGEIRGGEKRAGRNGKTYPARLDTWRLTGSEQVTTRADSVEVAKPMCGMTNGRINSRGIDYASDAAHCETCERRMAKLGHA